MAIALTGIAVIIIAALLMGVGWLVYKLKPESFRLTARFFKIGFELEMKSPRVGQPPGEAASRRTARQ